MLEMTQIYHIKYLFKYKGLTIADIARETRHDYKTIQKYIDQEDFNEKPKERKQKKSKLDPFKPVIDQWLTDDLEAPRKPYRCTGI